MVALMRILPKRGHPLQLAGQSAELTHQGKVIPNRPELDALAVLKPNESHLLECHRSVRRRMAHQHVGMTPAHGAEHRYRVAFGDDLMDFPVQLSEDSVQPHGCLPDALEALD